MQYTTLGKTGLNVSRLGFGTMRLPMNLDGAVDREAAIPLLHRALDLGVNYYDTAIFYCNSDSQQALGEAFEGMRDRVIFSTKNHMYDADPDLWWAQLEDSLKFLRTDYIDIYNLHGMSWEAWHKYIDGPNGKYKLMQKAKDQGLIRHIACSFHDTPTALVNLLDTGAFESITLQYNLLNRELEDAIHLAKSLNTGIVVMGPVGGGRLGMQSERIKALTGGAVNSTPEAALRFVLAHPGVTVALSGMSSIEMLEENVDIVSNKTPFTEETIARLDREVREVSEKKGVYCPACGYCKSCPSGIDIPGNFAIYNEYLIYGLKEHAQSAYSSLVERGALCTECGECLSKCPQKIQIPSVLRNVMAELDKDFAGFGSMLSLTGLNADASLRGKLTVKNISSSPIQPSVELKFEGGVVCEPGRVELPTIDSPASSMLDVIIKPPDGVGILRGTIITAAGEEKRTSSVRQPFIIIPRDNLRWHTPAGFAESEIAKNHGYRVGFRHDEDKIFVELGIRSEMLGLGRPGEMIGGRMELYVDMRPAAHGGRKPPYSEGADQFFISLGEPGFGAKSGRQYNLNPRNRRTENGVYITLELPFSDFLKPGWERPDRIGLDFMFAVANEKGIEVGYATYGERSGLWQNPGAFTLAYLV